MGADRCGRAYRCLALVLVYGESQRTLRSATRRTGMIYFKVGWDDGLRVMCAREGLSS